jgi:hypothetical protein
MESAASSPHVQFEMPGMPPAPRPLPNATFSNLGPGTQVKYVGAVDGGPRYGSTGYVRRTDAGRAYVDMGRSGRWHIPFNLLFVSPKVTSNAA